MGSIHEVSEGQQMNKKDTYIGVLSDIRLGQSLLKRAFSSSSGFEVTIVMKFNAPLVCGHSLPLLQNPLTISPNLQLETN